MKRSSRKTSTAPKKSAAGARPFRRRSIKVDGVQFRCFEGGQGNPVLVMEQAAATKAPALATLLAQDFHVVALGLRDSKDASAGGGSTSIREMARALDRAAAATGLDHYVIAADSASAPAALWQAIEAPERVEALVLVAPKFLDADGRGAPGGVDSDGELTRRLEEIRAPTLVLLGTNDDAAPRAIARAYARQIPTAYVVLVYDAGAAIQSERPEALLAAVRDFIQRREKFVVNTGSTAINP